MPAPVAFSFVGEAMGVIRAADATKAAFASIAESARAAAAVATRGAREQVTALDATGTAAKAAAETAMAAAKEALAAEVQRREGLKLTAVALKELSAAQVKGSQEQLASAKLARDAVLELRAAYIGAADAAVAGAKRSAEATRSSAGKTSSEERGAIRGATGRGLGFASNAFLAGAVGGLALKDILAETKRAQDAQALLRQSVAATGNSWIENRKRINETLDATEKMSAFDKVDLRDALATMTRGTGDLNASLAHMGLVTDIARARHAGLEQTTILVTKAMEGNSTSLKRLGIDIPKVTTYTDQLKEAHVKASVALKEQAKQLDLNATKTEVMRVLTQKFSGSAAAYAKTLGGRLDELHNSYRDLEKTIGTAVTPTLTKFVGWLGTEIDKVRTSKELHKDLRDGLAALKTILDLVVTALRTTWAMFQEGTRVLGSTKTAIEVLLALVAVNKMRGIAQGIVTNLIDKGILLIGPAAMKAETGAVTAFGGIGIASEELSATIKGALISTGIGALVVAVGIAFTLIISHWDTVKRATIALGGAIEAAFHHAFDIVKGVVQLAIYSMLLSIEGMARGLAAALGWIPGIGGKIKAALNQVVGFVEDFRRRGVADMASAGSAMSTAWGDNFKSGVQGALTAVSAQVRAAMASGNTAALSQAGFSTDLLTGKKIQSTGGYRALAAKMATLYGVPAELFLAQINQESGFNPNARSGAGAEGIAQFMPATAAGYHINPMNPNQALDAAAKMMASLYAKYGSWAEALSVYNSGRPTAYLDPNFAKGQTYNYVRSILGSAGMGYDTPVAGGGASSFEQNLANAPRAGARKKPPDPYSASNAVPTDLQDQISSLASKARRASGQAAVRYLKEEQADLDKAIADVKEKLRTAPKKDIPGLKRLLQSLTNQRDDLGTSIGSAIVAAALPPTLLNDLKKQADLARNSHGKVAAKYLEFEAADLRKVIADLTKAATDVHGRAHAEIEKQLTDYTNKLRDVHKAIADALVVVGDALLPAKLKAEVTAEAAKAKNEILRAQYAVGEAIMQDLQLALTAYQNQASYLEQEKNDLKNRLSRTTNEKQRAAIKAELAKVQAALDAVTASVQSTLEGEVSQLQSSVSTIQGSIGSDWGQIQSAIIAEFERQTQAQIAQLGRQFFQNGVQTPSERMLAQMTQQDQDQQAQDAYATAMASNDPKVRAAGQRVFDEYQLQIKATKERAKADADYAKAVEKYTAQRTAEEQKLNIVLDKFGVGVANGTVSVGDLQSWLDGANVFGVNFGVSLQGLTGASDVTTFYFNDLTKQTLALAKAMADLAALIGKLTGGSYGSGGPRGGSNDPVFHFAPQPPPKLHLPPGLSFQADGGDYMVDRPTLFVAGDRGRERATFQPMRPGMSVNGGQGGDIHYHMTVLGTTDREVARALARVVTPAQKRQVGFKSL